jgi:ABC-type protease/lipase transport system fused ATPase/permease subunit
MAMRPAVRNKGIMLIVFSVVQWLFMRYILANNLFHLDTYDRIVYFCLSSILGALAIFVALMYMVLKGNPEKD